MIRLAPFQPSDQAAARALILAGLVEHWGWLDESKNPDLEDIRASFSEGLFLVARQDGRLVGTGGLLPTPDPQTWQIVRMSVAADQRRAGLGRLILEALEREAQRRGARRLILETTAAWQEVIGFYQRCGYRITGTNPAESAGEGLAAPQEPPCLISMDVYFEKWI